MNIMELADEFAGATATFTLEHLYGTSKSYTAEKQREGNEARAALAAAVERNEALLRQALEALETCSGDSYVGQAYDVIEVHAAIAAIKEVLHG